MKLEKEEEDDKLGLGCSTQNCY